MWTKEGWLLVPVVAMVTLLAISGCAPTAVPPTPTKAPPAVTTPAATATLAPATPTPKPATVKFGATQTLAEAALYLAIARGYFEEEGVTNKLTPAPSVTEHLPFLAKGDLDLALGGWAASIAAAIIRGVPLKVVADGGSHRPGFSSMAITVRKDVYDEGKIRVPADLKGKKIAVTAVPALGRYVAPLLAEAKLTLKDVDFVTLSFPDTMVAYANKSIDAAVQIEPVLSQTLARGLAVRWKAVSDYRPGFQGGVVVASPQFVENREVANRWMVAYLKGIRAYLDIVITGKGIDELIAVLAENTPVKDRAVYEMMLKEKTMIGFDPNGYVNKDSLATDLELYLAEGWITERVEAAALVDTSALDYAVQKLGKR